MKTAIILFLIASPALAASQPDFSCTMTQMIESIDGQMKPRNRTVVLKKSLPSQGFGRFEEIFSDPADLSGKKFRIQAKLEKSKGQWSIQQEFFQVLSDGEREGKDLGNRITAIEVLRTTEQVYRGQPKTEYRLQCAVRKTVEEAPLFANNIDTELTLDAEGEAVDISQRQHMARIQIPYAAHFIQKDAKLDPKVFNRVVDLDPKLAEKPSTVSMGVSSGPKSKVKETESSWREIWPFRLLKKSEPVVLNAQVQTLVRLAHAPVKKESSVVEANYRKVVSPTRPILSQPVPLVLAPQSFKKVWLAYQKTKSVPQSTGNRQPASSEKEYVGIRPAMVNGVPTVPTPLIRIWSQFRK